jgi:S-adenosyl-L-methionine hydrolase (adenosine-forming)
VNDFRPSGVITLTTDFGHKGPFTATIKGVMLARFADARIIDLTHEIVPHWPAEAGFWLERAFQYFPPGTVHCAIVDPGVGTQRDIIAGSRDGHMFIAPDNGLLAGIFSERSKCTVHTLDTKRLTGFGISTPSATFEGRDVFAPLTAELAAGRITLDRLGPEAGDLVPSWVEDPTESDDKVAGTVITVDTFGNLFTNIDAKCVERFNKPLVNAGGHDIPVLRTYGDVSPGDYLALINSFGVVEIARSEQSASDGLGLERGAPVILHGDG